MNLPISIATNGNMNTMGKSPRAMASDGYLNQLSIRTLIVGGQDYNKIRSDDDEIIAILERIFGGMF